MTKTTAESAANGQKLFHHASGTEPSNRKSRAITNASRTMSTSTSMAAARRMVGDEKLVKRRLSLPKALPMFRSLGLMVRILERMRAKILAVVLLFGDAGQKEHEYTAPQYQGRAAQEAQGRTSGGEEGRQPREA